MSDALAFVLRRASRYWQVLIVLAVGVVLATALLSSAPLLTNTVVEFAMRRTLLDADPLQANIRLSLRSDPDPEAYPELDAAVTELAQVALGKYVKATVPSGDARWIYPWVDGRLRSDRRVRLSFYDRPSATDEGLAAHAQVVSGEWPATSPSDKAPISVAVGERMAKAYELTAGDRLALSYREDAAEPDLWIEIGAVLRAEASSGHYWFGSASPLLSQHSAHYETQYGALVPSEVFLRLASNELRESQVGLSWNVLLDPGAIVLDDVAQLRASLLSLEERAAELESGLDVQTGLVEQLGQFSLRSKAIQAPLYFLIATVMLVALYYVTMDAALSLRQFEREFAVLRSRGASVWQLLRAQLVEASLVSTIALLSGPGLGLYLVRGLVTLGPLSDVREVEWALWLPASSWLAAGIGAAACWASLLAPVPAAIERSIVAQQQRLARAEQQAWWQRYYVDVFVLLAGIIFIGRMRIYGGMLGGDSGQPTVDWLLLLAPLALLLGSAAILLRVFPSLLNVAAHWASRARGLVPPLALWRIARDPTHVARLVLLLTLSIALGVFSTGLNAALDRNEYDQSYYAVGGDLRVTDLTGGVEDVVRAVPGVASTSAVLRAAGTVALQSREGYPAFDLLAVDGPGIGRVSRFRPDFASVPPADLIEHLVPEAVAAPTLELPAPVDRLGLWGWLPGESEALAARLAVVAKVADARDDLHAVRLHLKDMGGSAGPGWHYYEGDLQGLPGPLGIHSLWLRNATSSRVGRVALLVLGDLVAIAGAPAQREELAGFSGGTWETAGGSFTIETIRVGTSPPGASFALRFPDDEMRSGVWYGLLPAGGSEITPLAALVSPLFQSQCQVDVGDRIGTWIDSLPVELRVVGTVGYFPTLYEEQSAGFLVTSLVGLAYELNRLDPDPVRANELLVAFQPGRIPESKTLDALGLHVERADKVRRAIKADPLALGLRSVTLFGYLLTAVLSLAGFGTHFYLSTRRHGRVYVMLRALGLSPRQLYATLLLEQAVLILAGLGLGTVLGLLLNRLTLPGLPLSLAGRPPVPPFLAETDWRAVGRIYASLAAAFFAALGLATGALWRTKLHRMLRVDEE
jgi:hypothetical protein